ncbi:PAS domain S-box-containing protein [Elusimicrobium posterum]|uniref:response regulator n=1 Tax=Elusimicrobium posterum TaxID=3116653 RepID=UPI003C78EBF7
MQPHAKETKFRSLSSIIGISTGLITLVFIACFISIFLYGMFKMLDRSEKKTLVEQTNMFQSLLKSSVAGTDETLDIFIDWNETENFLLGMSPDYTDNFWVKNKLLKKKEVDFVYFQDSLGRSRFLEFFNFNEQKATPAPEGFDNYASLLAKRVLTDAKSVNDFVLYNKEPLYVSAKPVFSKTSKKFLGVVIFGRIFDTAETRSLGQKIGLQTSLTTNKDPEIAPIYQKILNSENYTLEIDNKKSIVLYKIIPGFMNLNQIVLRMETPRSAYLEGINFSRSTGLTLGVLTLFFAFLIFYLVQNLLVVPLKNLSSELKNLSPEMSFIDRTKIKSKEFNSLAAAINTMLGRFKQSYKAAEKSKVSLEILQTILNGIDAYVYVADPESNDVLFMNENMKEQVNMEQTDLTSARIKAISVKDNEKRTSVLIKEDLAIGDTSIISWEDFDSETKHYYKNTDRLIEWLGGKTARLHHSVDITALKTAEDTLKKRLQQQELMTDISRNFISKENTRTQVDKALAMTGKFMNLDQIILSKYNRHDGILTNENKWQTSNTSEKVLDILSIPFKSGILMYDSFIQEGYQAVSIDDTSSDVKYENYNSLGIKSLMAMPIFVSDTFWGILQFETHKDKTAWTDSDKHLGKLIASTLSGIILRERVEKSLVKMSSIAISSPQYITCIDPTGKFTYFNPAALQISGFSAEELNEHGLSLCFDEHTLRKIKQDILPQVMEFGRANFELPFKTKHNGVRILSFSSFIIGNNKNDIGTIATDVTDQRRLEQELIKAKEVAEHASSAKGDFLARMSHEIRTPINAVLGMTNIAKGSKDMEKKDYCLEKIDNASTHLLGIINDILDMSKIEANKLELVKQEFDVEKMLVKVTNVANFRVDQKKQNLVVTIDRNVPQTIISDEIRLNQVITNLITNATKFTPDMGTIRVSVRKVREDGSLITLRFAVEDNGIGISKEQQARLFRSFEQADGSISRKFGGTGLGLAISKSIVELMGGEIHVESELGHGSKFIFTIEARKGQSHKAPKLDKSINMDNLRILAVDDAPEIREYFLNIMGMLGIKCEVAGSGEEALQMIDKNLDNPYNIIFVDWMMPSMNGVELAQKIKQKGLDKSVIIMISVAEWSEIEPEANKAGIERFIGKPLFPSALVDIINECMTGAVKHAQERNEQLPSSIKPDLQGRTILVAEDIDINREIMIAFMEGTNAKIEFAHNGRQAVDAFTNNPGKYSAILMDIQMPEMDGFEATRAIRAMGTEEAKNIPIIAMTANVFAEDIQRCLEAGMNDHLGKPVNIESMFAKLSKYLPASGKSGNTETKQNKKENTQMDYASFMPYIDIHDGLSRVLNNQQLYLKLLGRFDSKKMAEDLINSINEGDHTKISQAAHAIKGVAANLGFIKLKDASLKIESQAKVNMSIDEIKQLVPQFNETLEKTVEFIKAITEKGSL